MMMVVVVMVAVVVVMTLGLRWTCSPTREQIEEIGVTVSNAGDKCVARDDESDVARACICSAYMHLASHYHRTRVMRKRQGAHWNGGAQRCQ
jgi:hypothetical protein